MWAHPVTRTLARLGLDQRGDAPFQRRPAPMLLETADAIFSSLEWSYEPKWDGFRVLAAVKDGSVRLLSRNGHSFTTLFAPVADALRGFPTSILLDGEVIAIADTGRPDFEALQRRLRPRAGSAFGHLCYMVFDCLYVNGHSLLNHPLRERQKILSELVHAGQSATVRLTEGFPAAKSTGLMKACASMGLEGVVMKRKESVYRPGFRSPDWLKVPIRRREEFVVGGYLASGPSHLSTLIVGQYDRGGRLCYAGMVGTGLSPELRLVILRELQAIQRRTCPFAIPPELRDHFGKLRTDLPQWVRPSLVVEIEYRQRQTDGLRHAALKGFRPEKKPGLIRRSALGDRGAF
ncbi:MAG TPA: non-homologous end-joining DNA ligase [bacterium]|nr:non-homologous end-joining DNA ligase [bacterium]